MSQTPRNHHDPHADAHPVIPGELVPHRTAQTQSPGGVPVPPPYAPPNAPVQPFAPAPYGARPVPPYAPPLKSVGVAFVLTFFFGVFGMFYSTVAGALIMLGIVLGLLVLALLVIPVLSLLTLGVGSLLLLLVPVLGAGIWIGSIIWGCTAASAHNRKVHAQYAAAAAGAPPMGR